MVEEVPAGSVPSGRGGSSIERGELDCHERQAELMRQETRGEHLFRRQADLGGAATSGVRGRLVRGAPLGGADRSVRRWRPRRDGSSTGGSSKRSSSTVASASCPSPSTGIVGRAPRRIVVALSNDQGAELLAQLGAEGVASLASQHATRELADGVDVAAKADANEIGDRLLGWSECARLHGNESLATVDTTLPFALDVVRSSGKRDSEVIGVGLPEWSTQLGGQAQEQKRGRRDGDTVLRLPVAPGGDGRERECE